MGQKTTGSLKVKVIRVFLNTDEQTTHDGYKNFQNEGFFGEKSWPQIL